MEGLETKRMINVDESDEEDTAERSTQVTVRVTCISESYLPKGVDIS